MNYTKILNMLEARLKRCDLCPHKCHVDRTAGETGLCGNDSTPRIYQQFTHLGEEASIIPAYIVNMAGCSLSCPTCPERCRFFGARLPVRDALSYARGLAGFFEHKGVPNSLEWVGGEPAVQLPFVLETSWNLHRIMAEKCPRVLLNTSGYFDIELLDLMDGAIDGFVFDLKCSASCQREVTGFGDYLETVTRVIERAYQNRPDVFIVRHLVMPGHTECCTKSVIEWCRRHTPGACFNLMTGFADFRSESEGPRGILPEEKKNTRQWVLDARFESFLVDGIKPV